MMGVRVDSWTTDPVQDQLHNAAAQHETTTIFYYPKVWAGMSISLYGAQLATFTVATTLRHDRHPKPTMGDLWRDPAKVIALADGAKDPAGSAPFPEQVAYNFKRLANLVRDNQYQRLEYNWELPVGHIAAQLNAPGDAEVAKAVYGPPLKRMGEIALMLRAVLKMAYGDLYAAMDPLSSLFDGDIGNRLVDDASMKDWAQAVVQIGIPNTWPAKAGLGDLAESSEEHGRRVRERQRLRFANFAFREREDSTTPRQSLRSLEEIAMERYEWLVQALDAMLEVAANGGYPLQHQTIVGRFAAVHSSVWEDLQA